MSRAGNWATHVDAHDMMRHAGRYVDRRLVALAACACTRMAMERAVPEHYLAQRSLILSTLNTVESWAHGNVSVASPLQAADAARRELHGTDGWRRRTVSSDPRRTGDGKVVTVAVGFVLQAAAKAGESAARPAADGSLSVLSAASALCLVDQSNAAAGVTAHYVDWEARKKQLKLLAAFVRAVIPFPRQGTALAWRPGAIVYRTGPGRLGLQLAPRQRPSHRNATRAPVWWDGWIEGPARDVLDSIPDPELLRTVLELETSRLQETA